MSKADIISAAEDNSKWIDQNYEQLTRKYNRRWIAVLDKKVIDSDKNLDKITARLRKRLGNKYSGVVVEYITNKPLNMILPLM